MGDFSSQFYTPAIGQYQPGTGPMMAYGMPNGMTLNQLNTIASQDPGWFSRSSFFGGKDVNGFSSVGWGPALFGMGKSIFDGWMGLQQLDLAKDNLDFQKDAFSKQFENQRTLTNSELRDRQAARVASNPTAYQSVDDYMKANGV